MRQFFVSLLLLLSQLFPNFSPVKPEIVKHFSHLFEASFFEEAREKGVNFQKKPEGKVLGGIVPHHLLAAPLIAGFFAGLEKQKVETVILLGPDHYNAGEQNISFSKALWSTLYGEILPDSEKLSVLEKNYPGQVRENLFDNEHSIYNLTTFIKESFPQTKIIPIVLKSSTTPDEVDRLVQILSNLWDEKTLIIASVDFSHYLPSSEADYYDQISLDAIRSFALAKIITLDSQKNFDSPAAIYTLVKLMQLKGAQKTTLLENTNSAKLTNQPDLASTTSYVTMYFSPTASKLPLASIFDYEEPLVQNIQSNPQTYTLLATGDIILARSVNTTMVRRRDFTYPFAKTAAFLQAADIVFVNLESPLIPQCPVTTEGMIFCGDPASVAGLVASGVDVASLANNHMANQGQPGIENTVRVLEENKILVTGHGKPAIFQVKDKKFGFLGYNDVGRQDGISSAKKEQINKDIAALSERVDFVVVAFHWGIEYTTDPTVRQIDLAHRAIDAGADLVIGNHPHWVQGVEQYQGKFIAYSHGNFVFDQMWSRETREGVIGKYVFNNEELTSVQFYPIIIEDYAQPRFAEKDEARPILERMSQSSLKLREP